jgi:hypothetical protein
MTEEVKQLGIKETKDVVKLFIAISTDIKESFDDDGKITAGDFVNFSDSLMAIFPAITGIDQVIPELEDLDDEELVELKTMILDAVPSIGDKWVAFADNAIKSVFHAYKAFKTFPRG